MFLEVHLGSQRQRFHLKLMENTLCVGGLQLTFWKAIACCWRKQWGDAVMLRVQSVAKKTRCDGHCELRLSRVQPRTPLVRANQTVTLQQLTPPAQCSALSQQKHNPPITLFQYTYRRALPPSLLSYNTQKRGENHSPHKKSRWEYIIWSEKQFVLAIYCLCAKVISLSSSISAGSSYWVGGGHYTTWLQNLHKPLQRARSLSEWNPLWYRLCQIVFWLRLDDNNTPGFSPHLWKTQSVLNINLNAILWKLPLK